MLNNGPIVDECTQRCVKMLDREAKTDRSCYSRYDSRWRMNELRTLSSE